MPHDRFEWSAQPPSNSLADRVEAGRSERTGWKPSTRAALSMALVGLGLVGGGVHSAVAAPSQALVKPQTSPSLAVIDQFESPDSHGNLVDALLHHQSLKLPHRINEDVTGLALVETQAEFEEFVTDLMQYLPARALDQVTAQLDKINRAGASPIKTVNLSLALSKAGRFQLLTQFLERDPQASERMRRFLGLSEKVGSREFSQSLLNKLESLYDTSPDLLKSRQRYQQTLEQLNRRNIVVVVSAGNEGELQDQLRQQNLNSSPTFFDNLFSSHNHTINVGAVDGQHRLWAESNPGADLLAQGVAIPITVAQTTRYYDGTSFAAPRVAELIDEMRKLNPTLSRDQILDILRKTSDPVQGPRAQVGSGEINPARALQATGRLQP
ncbi:MAG: S8 family serine peptidase [Vulcanimicrobiota bacterium]